MKRRGQIVTTTRTTRPDDDGDPLRGTIRAALREVARLTPSGYMHAVLDMVNEPNLIVHIFKRTKLWGPTSFAKVGEVGLMEIDPDNIEPWVLQTWGAGLYQLKLAFEGRYYHPASMPFKVGEEEEKIGPERGGITETDALMQTITKRLEQLAFAKQLKDLAGIEPESKGDEGMKPEELAALITALKPDNTALTMLLEQSNRRADAAEARAHEMMKMMMEQRGAAAQGMMPVIGDLLKNVKPEVWQALLMKDGGGEAGGMGWLESITEIVKEFAPSLQTMMQGYLAQATQGGYPMLPAGPTAAGQPVPRRVAASPTSEPAPTTGGGAPAGRTGGGQPMPMPLNEEQAMAKDTLVEFVRANEYHNAFAVLESFPGFLPSAQGPVPLGEAILARVDPAVPPKVYLPMLAMIVPEVRSEPERWEPFIKWVQNKIMADDEAAAREGSQGREAHP